MRVTRGEAGKGEQAEKQRESTRENGKRVRWKSRFGSLAAVIDANPRTKRIKDLQEQIQAGEGERGLWSRKWGGCKEERVARRKAMTVGCGGLQSPIGIQMRINIYKRVRRWSSLLEFTRVRIRTLRGNIVSRTALRNEKYKGKETREKGKDPEKQTREERDWNICGCCVLFRPDSTNSEFSGERFRHLPYLRRRIVTLANAVESNDIHLHMWFVPHFIVIRDNPIGSSLLIFLKPAYCSEIFLRHVHINNSEILLSF